MIKESKKDNRIELMRIIAMVLVIVLHVSNRYLLKMTDVNTVDNFFLVFINCITRVSVPLFFMISGIVNISKNYDRKKYFSRIFRMIVILIVWTLVYYFTGNYKPINLLHSLFSFLRPHLWYMYALIGLCIATPFISKMVKNLTKEEEKLFIILWIIISGFYYLFKVIVGLFGVNTDITHPVPIFGAAYYLGYYIVGYIIYNNYEKITKNKQSLLIFIAVLCVVINTMLTYVISLKNNTYYQGFFGYSNLLIMIPSLVVLILCLTGFKDKDYKIVKYVCPYAFGIYLSHVLVLDYFIKAIKFSNVFVGCICLSIISFVISYILIFIIKKIPYINKYIC